MLWWFMLLLECHPRQSRQIAAALRNIEETILWSCCLLTTKSYCQNIIPRHLLNVSVNQPYFGSWIKNESFIEASVSQIRLLNMKVTLNQYCFAICLQSTLWKDKGQKVSKISHTAGSSSVLGSTLNTSNSDCVLIEKERENGGRMENKFFRVTTFNWCSFSKNQSEQTSR